MFDDITQGMAMPLVLTRNARGGVDMLVRKSQAPQQAQQHKPKPLSDQVPIPVPILPSLHKISFKSWQDKYEAQLQRLVMSLKLAIIENIAKTPSVEIDVDWHAFSQRVRRLAYQSSTSSSKNVHRRAHGGGHAFTHHSAPRMHDSHIHQVQPASDDFAGANDVEFAEMMLETFGIIDTHVQEESHDECE